MVSGRQSDTLRSPVLNSPKGNEPQGRCRRMSRCVSSVEPPTSVGVPPGGNLWTRPPNTSLHPRVAATLGRLPEGLATAARGLGQRRPADARFGVRPLARHAPPVHPRVPGRRSSREDARKDLPALGRGGPSPRSLRCPQAPLATPARTIWSPPAKARSSLRSPTPGPRLESLLGGPEPQPDAQPPPLVSLAILPRASPPTTPTGTAPAPTTSHCGHTL